MFYLSLKIACHLLKGQARRDAFIYILSLLHTFCLLILLLQDHLFKGTEIKIQFLQLKQM